MERSEQTRSDDQQQQPSTPQQILVVGGDLSVKGSYESTKRRGVGEDFLIECDGREVRVHACVFETRIALFERELNAFRAERDRRRILMSANDGWYLNDIMLEKGDGGQTADLPEPDESQVQTKGRALIFHSKKSAAIHGISFPIFEQIVEWAYTGSFRVASGSVCDLLQAAAFFGLDRMKTKCEEYLTDKITQRNCLELCALAELHSIGGKLHKGVLKFIAENFSTLRVTKKFLQFDCVASLAKLLADDNLNVADEAEVFEFLVKWTNGDRANRVTHFDSLLGFVRFYQFSLRFFHDVVCECDLIAGSEEGRKRVEALKVALFKFVCCRCNFAGPNDASSLGSLLGVNVDTPRTQSRAVDVDVLICVGGCGAMKTNYLSIELFDPTRGEWRSLTSDGKWQLRSKRYGMGVVCVGKKLFVVGGSSSTVECLDLVSGDWSDLAPLKTARRGPALVALDGKWLYAIGGSGNGGGFLRSVERYDIARNKWVEVASMSVGRWGVAAAVYRGQIYVVGGDNDSASSLCERFDPVANAWTPIAPLLQQRIWCGVGVVGEHLYAIGGDDVIPIRHCERYSFAENKWSEIKQLSTPRQELGVSVLGSRVFAVGGCNAGQVLNTVEVYDTLTGEWTPSASLIEPRRLHGVACSSSQFARNL